MQFKTQPKSVVILKSKIVMTMMKRHDKPFYLASKLAKIIHAGLLYNRLRSDLASYLIQVGTPYEEQVKTTEVQLKTIEFGFNAAKHHFKITKVHFEATENQIKNIEYQFKKD